METIMDWIWLELSWMISVISHNMWYPPNIDSARLQINKMQQFSIKNVDLKTLSVECWLDLSTLRVNPLRLKPNGAIWQMTFSNAFSWIKSLYFDPNFTEVCSQGWNDKTNIVADKVLVLNRPQAVILANDGLIYWPITQPQWVNAHCISR